jgi:hypothetical protein
MAHHHTTKGLLVKICYKNNVGVGTTTKSISRSPQYVLVIYCFATPPMKLKQRGEWGSSSTTSDSKPPGPIIMMGQSETLSSSQSVISYLLHSFLLAGAQPVLCLSLAKPQAVQFML